MEVTIRELTAPDIGDSFLETLAALTDVGLGTEQALEVFRQRLRAGIRTYIALANGDVVGTLTLLIEQKFIHNGGKVGHVEDVAVRRDFQRRGVGQALVRHATDEAFEAGCYKVILNCRDDRVPFYEKLGYRRHDIGMRAEPGH